MPFASPTRRDVALKQYLLDEVLTPVWRQAEGLSFLGIIPFLLGPYLMLDKAVLGDDPSALWVVAFILGWLVASVFPAVAAWMWAPARAAQRFEERFPVLDAERRRAWELLLHVPTSRMMARMVRNRIPPPPRLAPDVDDTASQATPGVGEEVRLDSAVAMPFEHPVDADPLAEVEAPSDPTETLSPLPRPRVRTRRIESRQEAAARMLPSLREEIDVRFQAMQERSWFSRLMPFLFYATFVGIMTHWDLPFIACAVAGVVLLAAMEWLVLRASGAESPLQGEGIGAIAGWAALAGPLVGVLVAVGLWYGVLLSGAQQWGWFALVTVLFFLVQLLPLAPLAGGRLVSFVLFHRHPVMETVMHVLLGLVMIALAAISGSVVLWVIAGIILISATGTHIYVTGARFLRRLDVPIDRDSPNSLPDEALTQFIIKPVSHRHWPPKLPQLATEVIEAWRRVRVKPPGVGATVGMFLVYLLVWGIGLLAPLAIVAVETRVTTLPDDGFRITLAGRPVIEGQGDANGLIDGRMQVYDPFTSQRVLHGTWENGHWDGVWQCEDGEGNVRWSVSFADGQLVEPEDGGSPDGETASTQAALREIVSEWEDALRRQQTKPRAVPRSWMEAWVVPVPEDYPFFLRPLDSLLEGP